MAKQLDLRMPCTWGGARKGAGRPRAKGRRSGVRHERRPEHKAYHPLHVTMRAGDDVPSLRVPRIFVALRGALVASRKDSFQVVEFSVQRNHMHLVVEADDKASLTSGMNGLSVRCAKAVNRGAKREGRVWADRYHSEPKHNAIMVRNALGYVLYNLKKHEPGNAPDIDRCSSAPWFTGFAQPAPAWAGRSPLPPPRTWLLRVGWMNAGGPLTPDDAPSPEE
jgi:putative transposase